MTSLHHFIKIHSVLKYAGMFHPVADIQDALALVMRHHIKSEIIGNWLYCFTSPLIGFQLENIGFWYSFKHCAYIYSGSPKEGPADAESLEEIRGRLGSQHIAGGIMYSPNFSELAAVAVRRLAWAMGGNMGLYPNSSEPYPVLDKGQLELFQEVVSCSYQNN